MAMVSDKFSAAKYDFELMVVLGHGPTIIFSDAIIDAIDMLFLSEERSAGVWCVDGVGACVSVNGLRNSFVCYLNKNWLNSRAAAYNLTESSEV